MKNNCVYSIRNNNKNERIYDVKSDFESDLLISKEY